MMRRMFVAVVAAVMLSAATAAAQSPTTGMRYVMKMEMRQIPGAEAPPAGSMTAMMVEMMKRTMAPEGGSEAEFVTDGQSARTEMHTAMAMFVKGTIILYPAGQKDGYVLSPTDKTYWVLKPPTMPTLPAGVTLPKPEIAVKRSGTFDTIVGQRAEQVTITWRMLLPVPQGVQVPPGMPTEFVLDMDNWCSTDLQVPGVIARMMGGLTATSLGDLGMDEIVKACPFALRSRLRMSMMPGYEMLTSVTSATQVPVSPDLFNVPADYKAVPAPGPKVPGVGDQGR